MLFFLLSHARPFALFLFDLTSSSSEASSSSLLFGPTPTSASPSLHLLLLHLSRPLCTPFFFFLFSFDPTPLAPLCLRPHASPLLLLLFPRAPLPPPPSAALPSSDLHSIKILVNSLKISTCRQRFGINEEKRRIYLFQFHASPLALVVALALYFLTPLTPQHFLTDDGGDANASSSLHSRTTTNFIDDWPPCLPLFVSLSFLFSSFFFRSYPFSFFFLSLHENAPLPFIIIIIIVIVIIIIIIIIFSFFFSFYNLINA